MFARASLFLLVVLPTLSTGTSGSVQVSASESAHEEANQAHTSALADGHQESVEGSTRRPVARHQRAQVGASPHMSNVQGDMISLLDAEGGVDSEAHVQHADLGKDRQRVMRSRHGDFEEYEILPDGHIEPTVTKHRGGVVREEAPSLVQQLSVTIPPQDAANPNKDIGRDDDDKKKDEHALINCICLVLVIFVYAVYSYFYKTKVVDKIAKVQEAQPGSGDFSPLLDCLSNTHLCLHTVFCLPARVAHTWHVAGVIDFWPACLCMFFCPMPAACLAGLLWRRQLRKALGFIEGGAADCLCWIFCGVCAAGQEAIEVDRVSGAEVTCCFGLQLSDSAKLTGAPVKVPKAAPKPAAAPAAAAPAPAPAEATTAPKKKKGSLDDDLDDLEGPQK